MQRLSTLAIAITLGSFMSIGSGVAQEKANPAECDRLCPGIACPANCPTDAPQHGSTDRGVSKMPAPVTGKSATPGNTNGNKSGGGASGSKDGTGDAPSQGR